MKHLGSLNSLSFFCTNGTCEAAQCRCGLRYEPVLSETFWNTDDITAKDVWTLGLALAVLAVLIWGI